AARRIPQPNLQDALHSARSRSGPALQRSTDPPPPVSLTCPRPRPRLRSAPFHSQLFEGDPVSDGQSDIKDVTIIGGGPVGLFAAFYAGLRGVSCRVIAALPQLGGQLMALYPEKYVYDVGGLPKILAKDPANNMIEQGTQFGPEVILEAEVQSLEPRDGVIALGTPRGEFL